MMKTLLRCAAPLALVVAGGASAQVTVYTDQAAFLAAISAPGVDTFSDLGSHVYIGSPITRAAGGYGYTASAANGLYGEGAGASHWLSTNTATDPITLSNFTGGVFGAGGLFFPTDFGGNYINGGVNFTVSDASGNFNYTLTNAATNSFVGFVSTSGINSLSFSAVQNGVRWPTVGNLTLGGAGLAGAVPEPATWALMILGMGAVGAAMRRKRATTSVNFA